ncbi:GNAT family N-acetyltransferase [Vibrio plantisponsor]|uniref:GNAT family N-acetyltransferase n=1 Tax=Vibrio plantisponsor TaxID=664643 RepID=A0ABU4IKW4_9VIBR|nr:GNAT family N-acetyltransferase [Vibrio plantisponsor]MDW6019197.1 GNAT family N-acetyltransferase [Vibrio plantisponsor]NNM41932.1 GNAT family N-acetyltransferase [Vibrio plantisponsor]
MNHRIDIRMSCSDDVYDIWQLMCEHADYEGHTLVVSDQLHCLENHTYPAAIWVVEIDSRVVGYMSLIKQFSTWEMKHYLYLDCLYLRPEVRGKGLGKAMMMKASELADELSLSEIQWQTPTSNTNAIGFYRKLGAINKEKQRFFWNHNEFN